MCYTLARKAFDELLGPIEDVWRFEALRKVPVLFALSELQLFELARCMKNHAISAGQMVFRQGDPGVEAPLTIPIWQSNFCYNMATVYAQNVQHFVGPTFIMILWTRCSPVR